MCGASHLHTRAAHEGRGPGSADRGAPADHPGHVPLPAWGKCDSGMRDAMCAALWRTVCDGDVGERAEIEARMREGKEKRASELAL